MAPHTQGITESEYEELLKKYGNLAIEKAARAAYKWRKQGYSVYFKFICKNCGSRQTFTIPNTLFRRGRCEECGYVSRLDRVGFTVVD